MKNISIFMLMTGLFTIPAFAQNHIKCDFKIPDNDVGCFTTLMKCPEKKLQESKKSLQITIHEGQQTDGQIKFNHIVLHPGTKKQDKNRVYLFEGDTNHEKIRDEKNVDLVAYESSEVIDYSFKKEGPFINIEMKSSLANLSHPMEEYMILESYLPTSFSAINVRCERINNSVFDSNDRRQKALNRHSAEKKEREAAQARNE